MLGNAPQQRRLSVSLRDTKNQKQVNNLLLVFLAQSDNYLVVRLTIKIRFFGYLCSIEFLGLLPHIRHVFLNIYGRFGMAELPKLFSKIEDIRAREDFCQKTEMSIENFESLIGEYHFPKTEKCQIKTTDRGLCGNNHQHGWLAKTKDGKEVLIGVDCANKHFSADDKYKAQTTKVRNEIEISQCLEKLGKEIKDPDSYILDINSEIKRLKECRLSIRSLTDNLSSKLKKRLIDIHKTGNNIVTLEFQYKEKTEYTDKNGQIREGEKSDWLEKKMFPIAGYQIFDSINIKNTLEELESIKSTVPEIIISRQSGLKKLKKWTRQLDSLAGLKSSVDKICTNYDVFSKFENLTKVVYLTGNRSEQISFIEYSLQFHGKADNKDYLSEMDKGIRLDNDNRNFRIPK